MASDGGSDDERKQRHRSQADQGRRDRPQPPAGFVQRELNRAEHRPAEPERRDADRHDKRGRAGLGGHRDGMIVERAGEEPEGEAIGHHEACEACADASGTQAQGCQSRTEWQSKAGRHISQQHRPQQDAERKTDQSQ